MANESGKRRLLVIRPRALGDVLLSTPAIRALRAGFPEWEIHAAIDEHLAVLLQANPHVDRLWKLPQTSPRWRAWRNLLRAFMPLKFDLVLDLHGTPRTAVLTALSGAPRRIGYALRGRGRLYSEAVPRDVDRHGYFRRWYTARMNLEMVARCGVEVQALDDTRLVFEPRPECRQRLAARLQEFDLGPPVVGVSPAGTWPAKTWSLASFAAAADEIARQGTTIVIFWGPGEKHLAERLQTSMQERAFLAPALDIEELAVALEHIELLLCNDSGIKHLAVARDTPTLTIFGPTDVRAWMPESGPHYFIQSAIACTGCNLRQCSHHLCMRNLSPQHVARKALAILNGQMAVMS